MTIFRLFFTGIALLAGLLWIVQPAAAAEPSPVKYTVSGTVNNEAGKPMTYVTVGIFAAADTLSSRQVGALVTDDRGRFTLPVQAAGSYRVVMHFAGYAPAERLVSLDESTPKIDLGTVGMTPRALEASAVTVKAYTPLVTSDIDKISYNLEADPETSSLTALEMMRKVPMLTLDGEENIKLKGQGNFKFLVNGRPSSMISGSNYREVLRSIPASQIRRIEVITNPPAKYDAEGLGGLINIVMDRQTSGSYNGSLAMMTRLVPGGGVSLSPSGYAFAGKGKFNIGISLYDYWSRSVSQEQATSQTTFNNPTYYSSTVDLTIPKSYHNNLGGTLDLSYEIDTANLLNLSFKASSWGNNGPMSIMALSQSFNNAGTLTQAYNNRLLMDQGQFGGGMTFDYQHAFRRPDETLTFSYNLGFTESTSDKEGEFTGILNFPSYRNRSDNQELSREHTFQLDYFNPITKKHQIETGAKYIMRPNGSESTRELWNGTDWANDPLGANGIDYTQQIGSLYAGYRFNLAKFGIKTGLRGEYTDNGGTFHLLTEQPLENHYFNLIPYLTFNFKPKPTQNISLGYTQRLSRPDISYLNPYVNDIDPKFVMQGNPELEAEVGHKFDFSYGIYKPKFNVNVSATAMLTDNAIEQVIIPTAEGGTFQTYRNTAHNTTYGLYFYGSLNPWNNKATFSLNAGVGYGVFEGKDASGTTVRRDGISNHNAWLSVNTMPWKNGNIFVNGGYYKSGRSSVQSEGGYIYYGYSLGVSQWFLNRKFQLSANAQSPFLGKMEFSGTSSGRDFTSTWRSTQMMESYSLTARWMFGKSKAQVKKASRVINNEDLKKGGGGGLGVGGSGGGQ